MYMQHNQCLINHFISQTNLFPQWPRDNSVCQSSICSFAAALFIPVNKKQESNWLSIWDVYMMMAHKRVWYTEVFEDRHSYQINGMSWSCLSIMQTFSKPVSRWALFIGNLNVFDDDVTVVETVTVVLNSA